MKEKIRQFIPKPFLLLYHAALAVSAAVLYRFPSKKLIVVGVTGTNGKTTTCNIIAKILEEAGYKAGLTTTANFKIGEREWVNETKQTMQGRFELQRLLRQMVKEECDYAVIETSSEGLAQHRHLGINYDVAVLTNLTPEHIESHGSFANYKEAKGKLFKKLLTVGYKTKNGNKIPKVSVVNLDSKHAAYFLDFFSEKKWGFGKFVSKNVKTKFQVVDDFFLFGEEKLTRDGTKFVYKGENFKLKLLGLFNIYNAAAAACVGLSQKVNISTIKSALEKIRVVPGRMERIDVGQDFLVIVDYAHEPVALKYVYKSIKPFVFGKMISVLGSCGGGRDKRRRPKLGKLAARYTDYVIVTNEDPYDEDPKEIINQVARGAVKAGKKLGNNLFKILDRRSAIRLAIKKARVGDAIIITGKGSEQCIVSKKGRRIPWDDREAARELLKDIVKKQG
jgi:UDP-N-acetylmuramoyl-L-alanyl-D-glutamate--2,6-diaminopimelate ligase